MKNSIYLYITALTVIACQNTSVKKPEKLGYQYEATLPCADCPGIKTVLTFEEGNRFISTMDYLERDVKFVDSGDVKALNDSIILLTNTERTERFLIKNDELLPLDTANQRITGPLEAHYIYKKTK